MDPLAWGCLAGQGERRPRAGPPEGSCVPQVPGTLLPGKGYRLSWPPCRASEACLDDSPCARRFRRAVLFVGFRREKSGRHRTAVTVILPGGPPLGHRPVQSASSPPALKGNTIFMRRTQNALNEYQGEIDSGKQASSGIQVWGAHFRPHPVRSDPGGAPPYRPLLNSRNGN